MRQSTKLPITYQFDSKQQKKLKKMCLSPLPLRNLRSTAHRRIGSISEMSDRLDMAKSPLARLKAG